MSLRHWKLPFTSIQFIIRWWPHHVAPDLVINKYYFLRHRDFLNKRVVFETSRPAWAPPPKPRTQLVTEKKDARAWIWPATSSYRPGKNGRGYACTLSYALGRLQRAVTFYPVLYAQNALKSDNSYIWMKDKVQWKKVLQSNINSTTVSVHEN